MKSLLSDRSIKVIFYGKWSVVGYQYWQTTSLLYINDLPKNTLTLLLNIYAEDATVCGCTSKYLDDLCMTADHSAELILTAQWGKECLISSNTSKMKRVIFHHHRTKPQPAKILIIRDTHKESAVPPQKILEE